MAESQSKSTNGGPKKAFEPVHEDRSFSDVLKAHLGEVFLIANSESFEESGFGHQIAAGWYRARLAGLGHDFLIVHTEFAHGAGKHAVKEPVKQYIPLARVKRISLMRSERILHV